MKSGYIAIVSALIVTGMLFLATIIMSTSNYLGYSGSQELEFKDAARSAAEGCLEYARLSLATNPSYAGNETISVGSSTCAILPIETGTSTIIIKASSTVQNAQTNIKLTVDSATLQTVSKEEVASF